MIDMMVILVFFLIFTAVFTQDEHSRAESAGRGHAVPDLPEGLNLEVIVRKDTIQVADRGTGVLKELPLVSGRVRSQGPVRLPEAGESRSTGQDRRDDSARAGHRSTTRW